MGRKTATDQRLDDIKETIDKGFERIEKALAKHVDDDKEQFDDHCDRINGVELKLANLFGKLAVVAALASTGVALAAKYILP